MTDHRIEGVAVALSSIAHGGDKAGTVQYLRREKVLQPDGTVCDVPIVSGNALRGILRDASATLLWEWLGRPELPLPVVHALWSGGSLAKAGSSAVLSGRQLAELRRLVPHVGLFGCSGGGRIIEGRLSVGKLVPIVAETAHIVPAEMRGDRLPSMWDGMQIEEFSRQDDSLRAALSPAIGNGERHAVAALLDTQPAVGEVVAGASQQMRYGMETIAAGTRLHWWMSLRGVSDLETATLRAALSSWAASGAHIGGRSSTGHGRLRLDVAQWIRAEPAMTAGTDLAVMEPSLAEHVRGHRDAIITHLGGLT